MKLYLVRHGQTRGNVAHRHQAESTPLTEQGIEQAKKITSALVELQPTHLVASPLIRTIETARIINEELGLTLELEHSLVELERPKYLYGWAHYSPQSIFYYLLWFLGLENTALAGESYKQVRQRIIRTKEYLATYPKDARVVVVTHSVFMSLLIAHICNDKALSLSRMIWLFIKITKMPNTHMIKLDYDPASEGCKWREVTT